MKILAAAIILILMVTGALCWAVEAMIGVGRIDRLMTVFISALILNMVIGRISKRRTC
jgi:hypothetical protein